MSVEKRQRRGHQTRLQLRVATVVRAILLLGSRRLERSIAVQVTGMAGAGGARAMSRSLLSTARSAVRACRTSGSEAVGGRVKARSPCATPPPPSASPFAQTRRPASFIFRLPGEVACVQSLLPLHSATASSRLVAQLSTTAGALLQDDEDGT